MERKQMLLFRLFFFFRFATQLYRIVKLCAIKKDMKMALDKLEMAFTETECKHEHIFVSERKKQTRTTNE